MQLETLGGETLGGEALGGETLGGETLGGETMGGETLGGQTLGGQALGGDEKDNLDSAAVDPSTGLEEISRTPYRSRCWGNNITHSTRLSILDDCETRSHWQNRSSGLRSPISSARERANE